MKSVGPVGAEPSLLVPLAGFWILAVSAVSHFILTVMSGDDLQRLLQSAESEQEACWSFTLT